MVEDSVKDLMQRLGDKINQSISDSKEIAAILDQIKQAATESPCVEATVDENKGDEDHGELVELGAPRGGTHCEKDPS